MSGMKDINAVYAGIAQRSNLILDSFGIIVDENKLYQDESIKLGRELSDIEKVLLFHDEVVRQLTKAPILKSKPEPGITRSESEKAKD